MSRMVSISYMMSVSSINGSDSSYLTNKYMSIINNHTKSSIGGKTYGTSYMTSRIVKNGHPVSCISFKRRTE